VRRGAARTLPAIAAVVVAACGGRSDAPSPKAPTAAPAPTTAPAPAPPAPEVVAAALTPMQLAGQMVVGAFRASGPAIPAALRRAIGAGAVGGVILFRENGDTVREAAAITHRLRAIRRPAALRRFPLLVMVDQEGGAVRRLADAAPVRDADAQARSGPGAAWTSGRRAAAALRRAGINVNLAPVADVAVPTGFLRVQRRSYGGDPAAVAQLAAWFARGSARGGVAATAKHFPGLGRAARSTDDGRVVVEAPLDALRAVDERPFRDLVAAGDVDLVMVANAVYPALDARPAVFSSRVVTGELRGRLGFGGVVITDDLEARSLAEGYGGPGARAIAAVGAGADLVLYGARTASALRARHALTAAIAAGRVARPRAVAAVARILELRARLAAARASGRLR